MLPQAWLSTKLFKIESTRPSGSRFVSQGSLMAPFEGGFLVLIFDV